MAKPYAGTPSLRRSWQRRSIIVIAALWGDAFLGVPRGAGGQGISTVTIRGTVRAEDGSNVEGARVRVLNTATGFTFNTHAASGRFFLTGLDVGGLYVVEVRRIGFLPQRTSPLHASLGEPLDVQFVLKRSPVRLDQISVTAPETGVSRGGGSETIIRDSLLHQLPTLNRDFLDFVQLAPQVSTKVGFQRGGMSAAGANLRFNNYLINGADEHFVNSNVSPAHNGGKSVPIDAVKEYQVLVAPYDVRYGDFAGALVNTATQAGTNELRGSAFVYWRNNRLARGGDAAPDSLRYERWVYGFSLGGPVVRDRVHFFLAPEFQRLTSPALGPYLGQPPNASPPVPVREADVARFAAIMRDKHGLAAGSGGYVEVENPLRNLFARIDGTIPQWNSRLIGFVSYTHGEASQLERFPRDFYLSSSMRTVAGQLRLTSLQFHTDVPRAGAHNELLVSHSSDRVGQCPAVRQPLVRVDVPSTDGGTGSLVAGALEQAQGGFRRSEAIHVKDELTFPWGARHVLVLGMQAQRFRIQPAGVSGRYGAWTFSNLDSLERGIAERFELRRDSDSATTELRGGQYAAYAGDEWRAVERLSVTLGLRADLLAVKGHAPYNAAVDSLFGRRTDEMPRPRVHLSPRVGFTWDLSGTGRDRLRGGVGIFTGRPPLAWLHPALVNYGVGIGSLSCGFERLDVGPPPPFQPDYRKPPTACATGPSLTTAGRGAVNLLDRDLRMAQSLRASLAYDRRLPWDLVGTGELLVTRYVSDFMFVNLNLQPPKAMDRFARVMYATIGETGAPEPAVRSTLFSEVIDLQNTSQNYSHQLSVRLDKRVARGTAATASYTYSRTRDVQSPSRIGQSGLALWADARAVSGRHDDVVREISLNDVPHRVVAVLTYTAPWDHWSTGVSLYYVGESGSPFTYRSWGVGRKGDLNADGSNRNDPIYVPRSALDTAEIRFSGKSDAAGADTSLAGQAARERQQQIAFDSFVRRSPCLQRQRGRIMERNSCREPWSHTTIAAVRQAVPVGGRALEAELDVFNILNVLNADWGHYRTANPDILEHVGQTKGSAETSQPIFHFNAARAGMTTLPTESAFQLQLALRYRY